MLSLSSRTKTAIRNALLLAALLSVASACSWDYVIWIPRNPDADPLFRYLTVNGEDSKGGYIDKTGHVVIPASLEMRGRNSGDEFHDGLMRLSYNGKYINTKGEVAIDGDFESAWDFSEGLAAAMPKNSNKWGYIDTKGNFAILPQFDGHPLGYVSSFHNGLAMITVGEKVGYIDHSGRFVIPPRFLAGEYFHDDMARVVVEGPCVFSSRENICPSGGATLPDSARWQPHLPACKFTFINKDGQILDTRVDYALDFSEGLAPVVVGERWGYIDKSGAMVIPPSFDKAQPFSDGRALVKVRELFGYIDSSGNMAITPQFKLADNFSDGLALVGDGKSSWYIGKDGVQAFPQKFAVASPFFKGVANVQLKTDKGGKATMAYIDRQGKVIFQY